MRNAVSSRPRRNSSRLALTGLLTLTYLLSWLTPVISVHADDWMFRRSYYSHHDPAPVSSGRIDRGPSSLPAQANTPKPRSRSAYRPAIANSGIGFSVRGGYRFNRYVLQNGNSTDVTIFREDWIQFAP